MENVLSFLNNCIGCLTGSNEGYIGLTSFEKPVPDRVKRPELPEIEEESLVKQSFTGLLRRSN